MSILCDVGLHDLHVIFHDGADHFGSDCILRCSKCRRRTVCHVETSNPLSDEVAAVLRREWKHGETTKEPWV